MTLLPALAAAALTAGGCVSVTDKPPLWERESATVIGLPPLPVAEFAAVKGALRARGLEVGPTSRLRLSSASSCPLEVQSHRGDSEYFAEDSPAAIMSAVLNGHPSVELDVRRLGDGTWLVHHDPVTGRATALVHGDSARLSQLTAQDLGQVRLRDPANGELTDSRPSTLAETVIQFAELPDDAYLNVEIKSDLTTREAARIDAFLATHLPQGRYGYSSSSMEVLERLRCVNDNVYIGVVEVSGPVARPSSSGTKPAQSGCYRVHQDGVQQRPTSFVTRLHHAAEAIPAAASQAGARRDLARTPRDGFRRNVDCASTWRSSANSTWCSPRNRANKRKG